MTLPRRTPRRAGVVLAVLVPLALAGCGLDERSQSVADGIRTALSSGDDVEGQRDLAACTAERWVGEAGVARLRDDGLVTGDEEVVADNVRATVAGERPVSERTARDYALARASCLDPDVQSLATTDAFPDASAEERDDYARCLRDIDQGLLEDAITQRVLGNADAAPVRRYDARVERCEQTLR